MPLKMKTLLSHPAPIQKTTSMDAAMPSPVNHPAVVVAVLHKIFYQIKAKTPIVTTEMIFPAKATNAGKEKE